MGRDDKPLQRAFNPTLTRWRVSPVQERHRQWTRLKCAESSDQILIISDWIIGPAMSGLQFSAVDRSLEPPLRMALRIFHSTDRKNPIKFRGVSGGSDSGCG